MIRTRPTARVAACVHHLLRHVPIAIDPSGTERRLCSHHPDRRVRWERVRDQPNAHGDACAVAITGAAARSVARSIASPTERAELCNADSDGRTVHGV